MKTGVCSCCGEIIRKLTLSSVGTIRPQGGRSAEPSSDTAATPTTLSAPDGTGHVAVNSMTPLRPHIVPHQRRPVLFGGTREATADAGRSMPPVRPHWEIYNK